MVSWLRHVFVVYNALAVFALMGASAAPSSLEPSSGEKQILRLAADIDSSVDEGARADLVVSLANLVHGQDRSVVERPAVINAMTRLLRMRAATRAAAFILARVGPPARSALPVLWRELNNVELLRRPDLATELGLSFNEDQQPEFALRYAIASIEGRDQGPFELCRIEKGCKTWRNDVQYPTIAVTLMLRADGE